MTNEYPGTIGTWILLALLSVAVSLAGHADDRDALSPDERPFYVQFRSGQKAAVVDTVRRAGGRVTHDIRAVNAIAILLPQQAAAGLGRAPGVKLVEPVPEHSILSQVVPYNIDQVQARDVWDTDRDGEVDFGAPDGSGVNFCIIDSGFYAAHDDLAALSAAGVSQISGESWTEDGDGHGTHVAGTASALNNSIGVVGVTPGGMNLLIVKVFNNSGNWAPGQSNLGAAAQWCRDNGANVVSMSLGGGYSATEDAIFQGLYDTDGILNVAAAGNDGDATTSYPASYESVISVAAVDSSDTHAAFSQFPPTSYNPDSPPANVEWDVVELSGGGVGVLSTVPSPDGSVPIYQVAVDGVVYPAAQIAESGFGSANGLLSDGGLCDGVGSWTGTVVLCERGTISFADKINNVRDGGGLAALIYNNVPGNFLGTCGGNCTMPLIPALSLSQADGQFLVANKLGFTADATADDGSGCVGCTGGYDFSDGTSMATPAVAAGVAWVWNTCGGSAGITNKQLRQLLRDSARDLSGTSGAGSYGTGYDAYTGFGLIQLHDAYELGRQRFGSSCAIAFSVDPPEQAVCITSTPAADFSIELGPDFVGTTNLTAIDTPTGATVTFTPSSVTFPDRWSTLTLGNLGSVADGTHIFTVHAEDDTDPGNAAEVDAVVHSHSASPSSPSLISPANGSIGQPLEVTLTWSPIAAAASYAVEVATDGAFSTIVDTASGLTSTSYTVFGLDRDTTYHWRVWGSNACGDGSYSTVSSLTTLDAFCSASSVAIPDNSPAGVDSSITIGSSGTISDLDLSLHIEHSWIGDLQVFLTHEPTGRVTMVDRPGSSPPWYCDQADIDAILDDEGTLGAIDDACPPTVGGRYTPDSPLSAFDGTDISGTWTLTVADGASGITGQLVEWCLSYEASASTKTAAPVVGSPLVEGSTTVSGTTSEADGTTVEVFVNGGSSGSTISSSGSWSQTVSTLVAGEQVTAVATAAGKAQSDPSSVVTVVARPIADAGLDRSLSVNFGSTALGGLPAASSGTAPYNYLWTVTPSTGFALETPGDPNPVFFATVLGDYSAELRVTDAEGLTDSDTVVIRVECPTQLDLFDTVLEGTRHLEASSIITAEEVIVASGADVSLVSGQKVEFLEGFIVEAGAFLSVTIEPSADCQ